MVRSYRDRIAIVQLASFPHTFPLEEKRENRPMVGRDEYTVYSVYSQPDYLDTIRIFLRSSYQKGSAFVVPTRGFPPTHPKTSDAQSPPLA